jgi:hypothetical protein
MNGTHLTLVRTPSVAELEQLVDLEERATRRPTPLRPAALRLTRRGRLVLVGLFLVALFGGGVLFGTGSKAGASDQAGTPHSYVVIQPGQTLWSLAKQVAPDDDPRATIETIRRLNALPDTGVQAGQRIALP